MLTLREAFTLGYLPAAMGAYWNGVELLARISEQHVESGLKVRLQRCEAALREQAVTVAEDLLQVDTLLRKLGQQMPSLPRLAPDYSMWYGAILESAHERMKLDSPPAATCMMAGFQLGEAWETLSMAWLTYYFLVAVPDQPFLRAQTEVLGRGQEKGLRRARRLVENPLWTPPQKQVMAEIEAAFVKLPSLEQLFDLDVAAHLRAVQLTMETVSARLRSFPSLFPGERPAPPTG